MEIDFTLIKDREVSKTFVILNPDGTPHSMVGSTVILRVYKTPTPIELNGVVGGTNSNELSVTFGNTVNNELGNFEYEIIETPVSGPNLDLVRGNIIWLTATDFTTQIYSLIDGESIPFGVIIDSNYKTQSVLYWKLYLQPQFNIPDVDLELDTAWPVLVRFLIAKLVVHDTIVSQMKSSLNTAFGSSSGAAAPGFVKRIETGPSNAEWYDGGNSLSNILKQNSTGKTPFDELRSDICQLAHRVRALLPICGQLDYSPVIPIKGERPCIVDLETILIEYYG